jgi:hypothetical protein
MAKVLAAKFNYELRITNYLINSNILATYEGRSAILLGAKNQGYKYFLVKASGLTH